MGAAKRAAFPHSRRARLRRLAAAALAVAAVELLAGCAHSTSAPGGAPLAQSPAATQFDAKAFTKLDDLGPPTTFPSPAAATEPSDDDADQALDLYAQARQAELDGDRFKAIGLLERAVALDPASFDLYSELGQTYLLAGGPNDKVTDALEHAAAIRPNDLRTQTLLGKDYFVAGDMPNAIAHFRLARLTDGYRRAETPAASVDYYLGRALQTDGYDQAALDSFDALLRRLENPDPALRENSDIAFLLARPEVLYVTIGDLYAKHGQYQEALEAYEPAAKNDPSNFDAQARVVRTLANLGDKDQALRRASDVVSSFGADSDSIGLLREVCRAFGREDAVVDELKQLYAQKPDRGLLLALTQNLEFYHRDAEAQQALQQAIDRDPSDLQIVQALFDLYDRSDQVEQATRLVIAELSREPDLVRELSPMWDALLRPARRNSLRLATLQGIDVPQEQMAAKLFLVSQLAAEWRRDILARTSLEQAVKYQPPFAPAYRDLESDYWQRPDWSDAQRIAADDALADSAEKGGNLSLAEEVRGLSLLHQKQPAAAVTLFKQAMQGGHAAAVLSITTAAAMAMQGDDAAAQELLWKVVSDHPGDQDAWVSLFRFELSRGSTPAAVKVLGEWLDADPGSVQARVLQASMLAQIGHTAEAQSVLDNLFQDHGDNPAVVSAMFEVSRQAGTLDAFIDKLEDRHKRHPEDRTVTEFLVDIYASQGRQGDALRVVDQTRAALSGDADSLYQIAHFYDELNQKQTEEAVLRQVLKLDPNNAPACNDLGFMWADDGENLDESERLIRIAVAAEPDNQSFLDSLGWVLYKRGNFTEARMRLEQAIGPAALPDPVVLDHFGDILYRQGDDKAAAAQWKRALDGIDPNADRPDLKDLKLELMNKLQELQTQEPVHVAPIVGAPEKPV